MPYAQQNTQSQKQKKPVWMIKGTCGGCKGFDIKPGDDLERVKCTKPESSMNGVRVGMMQVNMCHSYEARTEVPAGFNLV
jgi:hypothetical protein